MNLQNSENKNKDLDFKANEAAREVVKHRTKLQEILSKKDDEIKLFKSLTRTATSETEKVNSELKSLRKSLKAKEKEVYNLENCNTNHQNTIKILKREAIESKSESTKLKSMFNL